MRDVLVRVTGQANAPELPNLAPLVAQASRYVSSFRRATGVEGGMRRSGIAGVVGAGLAIGVGELLAGLFEAVASPLAAVGGFVVAHSPSWVEDFAIGLFGTADKGALAIGTVVIALVVVSEQAPITTGFAVGISVTQLGFEAGYRRSGAEKAAALQTALSDNVWPAAARSTAKRLADTSAGSISFDSRSAKAQALSAGQAPCWAAAMMEMARHSSRQKPGQPGGSVSISCVRCGDQSSGSTGSPLLVLTMFMATFNGGDACDPAHSESIESGFPG